MYVVPLLYGCKLELVAEETRKKNNMLYNIYTRNGTVALLYSSTSTIIYYYYLYYSH